jgi:hypothetical protein
LNKEVSAQSAEINRLKKELVETHAALAARTAELEAEKAKNKVSMR